MAKEFDNDFYKELQNGVIKEQPKANSKQDKIDELISKREQLLKTLEEIKANVIVDPKTVKKLEKEIKDLEKAIEEGKMETQIDEDIEKDKELEEKETEEAIEKDEEELEETAIEDDEEQMEEKQRSDILKEQYEEALIALYEHRINSIELAKRQGSLMISKDAFERDMVLEEEMYRLRNEYLAMGFEDPFKEKRTEYIEKEKNAKEEIEKTLSEKAEKFREFQEEFERIDKEEQEIRDELLNRDISSARIEELNNNLEELSAKREDMELKLVDIRKELEPTIMERQKRTLERTNLDMEYLSTLTNGDIKNYNYQQGKINTMNKNVEKAEKIECTRLKKSIEDKEHRIKIIKKELEKTPVTDFEERLNLLQQLDEQVGELEMQEEIKAKADAGVKVKDAEREVMVKEQFEEKEDRKEEFEKDTKKAREITKAQDEKIGVKVVEQPIKETVEERNRETDTQAATIAILVEDKTKPGPDTVIDDVRQGVVAKCVIEGLEDKVRDPNVKEDAEAILANEETIEKANDELQRKQEEIEQKI